MLGLLWSSRDPKSLAQEVTHTGEVGPGTTDNTLMKPMNVNWFNHYGKEYGSPSKKLKIELPYDPAIPLLGTYMKNSKTFIRKDIFTPMFIAALLTVTKKSRWPRCPSIDD